ncbi:uncharacterized protein LOC143295376 [Babylonia areolata]|uniref:uncharacterized protein LOC143295376 n=1 Tax=Babylonia areolata TaxID=304850 RepID=UPI003FD2A2F3
MSGQDRSFQFYISRPYRWPQTLGQMRRHPRAQLAIDYVTGRVPVGSRYQWPHEVYREGWRPYRPQEKYCSSLMHLATLCNDHRLGGVGPAHVLLSTGSCVPSLFWTDSLGLCPLHWAVLRGDVTLLVYLLHAMRKVWTVYGDQPLQQDNAVQTAASLADRLPTRKQTFAEILQMAFELNLRLVGDSGVLYTLLVDSLQWVNLSVEDFSLCDAVHINFPNLVSRLLSDGCPVHCSSPQPFDPLHCAVVSLDDDFQDQLRIIQLLLQHGADPNRIGYIRATGVVVDNGTPLHFVLGSVCNLRSLPFRSHQMAQLLLEYGADPHRVNTDSQTCYHLWTQPSSATSLPWWSRSDQLRTGDGHDGRCVARFPCDIHVWAYL